MARFWVLILMAFPVLSLAQIDTTAATSAIADAAVAIAAVLLALTFAYFGFLGIRMVLEVAKRENNEVDADDWLPEDMDVWRDERTDGGVGGGVSFDPDDPEHREAYLEMFGELPEEHETGKLGYRQF